jgi:hypothetical protein
LKQEIHAFLYLTFQAISAAASAAVPKVGFINWKILWVNRRSSSPESPISFHVGQIFLEITSLIVGWYHWMIGWMHPLVLQLLQDSWWLVVVQIVKCWWMPEVFIANFYLQQTDGLIAPIGRKEWCLEKRKWKQ